MSGGLHDLTLTELAAGLSAKKFSSREIADALLARIEKADKKLHAFNEVYAKEARAMADVIRALGVEVYEAGLKAPDLNRARVVAKRIIDMAQRGVEDREALVTDALRFIAANYEQPSKLAK